MTNESKKENLHRVSQYEHLYKVSKFLAKTSAGVLAPVGLSGMATELFDLIVSDPATKRRDRFMMDLAVRIEELEEKGQISLESLLDNEESAALLIRTVQAAMRSSGDQKLLALQEAALKGLISSGAGKTSSAQIVVGLIDRMTEHHVIVLLWESRPKRSYTLGQMKNEAEEEARRSRFYGQPVFTDIKQLENPVSVFNYMDFNLYVEKDDLVSFKLAKADLVTMGLLEPVLGKESYLEGRVAKLRTTPDIVDYKISELGKFVCDCISSQATQV